MFTKLFTIALLGCAVQGLKIRATQTGPGTSADGAEPEPERAEEEEPAAL